MKSRTVRAILSLTSPVALAGARLPSFGGKLHAPHRGRNPYRLVLGGQTVTLLEAALRLGMTRAAL